MTALKHIGVLAHPLRPESAPVAATIAAALQKRNVSCWVETVWDEHNVRERVRHSEIVIAIGGDGAMLRASRVCAPFSVPVLGVNMGQLGFLAELRLDDWQANLDAVLEREYWIERRMMIHTSVVEEGRVVVSGDALNDAVISGGITRMIQLHTFIDGDWATTYNADALIIATPTGSTAYALACGGPILPPELHNILIVPVAPHLSMDRPLVLSQGATVEVQPVPHPRAEIGVSLDGVMLCHLREGQNVRVRASDHASRFVRLRGRNYFYRSLLDRLEPRTPRPKPEQRKLKR
ncbi:MAG: NAD(+)/NADH kinase [Chloroflexi bacterium]|nr:NAD(+)/NADH kinase [Chloroflexota bacterium]